MNERKEVNDLSAIFLMSDGRDTVGNTLGDIIDAMKFEDEKT